MFERPQGGERAILVQLALPGLDAERALAEFEELALSANALVLDCVLGTRATPDAKYYVGKGKAEEIAELVKALEV
ncbi:MAG: GTPase HflX, partial [Legionella sp.]